MAKKEREKGKRGEREFAALLRSWGFDARRGVQFQGGPGSPDVVTDIKGYHFEVKRVEALKLWPSIKQAQEDAGDDVPIVAHRPNNKPWLAIMEMEDFLALLSRLQRRE